MLVFTVSSELDREDFDRVTDALLSRKRRMRDLVVSEGVTVQHFPDHPKWRARSGPTPRWVNRRLAVVQA